MVRLKAGSGARLLVKLGFGIAQVLLLVRFAWLLFAPSPTDPAASAFLGLTQPILDVTFHVMPPLGPYMASYHAFLPLWDSFSGSLFDLNALLSLVVLGAVEIVALWVLGWDLRPPAALPPVPSTTPTDRPSADWYGAWRAWSSDLHARYGVQDSAAPRTTYERPRHS